MFAIQVTFSFSKCLFSEKIVKSTDHNFKIIPISEVSGIAQDPGNYLHWEGFLGFHTSFCNLWCARLNHNQWILQIKRAGACPRILPDLEGISWIGSSFLPPKSTHSMCSWTLKQNPKSKTQMPYLYPIWVKLPLSFHRDITLSVFLSLFLPSLPNVFRLNASEEAIKKQMCPVKISQNLGKQRKDIRICQEVWLCLDVFRVWLVRHADTYLSWIYFISIMLQVRIPGMVLILFAER